MAQQIENNGWTKFMMAVAVIVVAQMILAAAGAGMGAYMAISRVDLSLCYMDRRIDQIEFPKSPPRDCTK